MFKIKELTEITNQEFQSLTPPELRERIKDMNRWVQKRIGGFDRYRKGQGISRSPALVKYEKSGAKKLSYSKNLSYNELQKEYLRGMAFLKAESSTATGWDKIQSRVIKGIRKEVGITIKKADFDKFWETYQKLIEARPDLALPENKYEAFRMVANIVYGSDTLMKMLKKEGENEDATRSAGDTLVDALTRELDDLYEQSMQSQVDEIGGMFKLGKAGSIEEKKKGKRKKSKSKEKGKVVSVDTGDVDVDIEFDDIF